MQTEYRCYIGLGSNLEQPLFQIRRALSELAASPGLHLARISSAYQSRAHGPGEQPDYINAVAELHSSLPPFDLLDQLQAQELRQGRQRLQRWAARTLDLDILWIDNISIDGDRLTIPHPRICERNFVLFPLAELAPDLVLANGQTVIECAAHIGSEGLIQLADIALEPDNTKSQAGAVSSGVPH